jgi:hypothetical protein
VVRCKACGYIMKAGKLGDRCPACGAPRTAFEPYTNPILGRRELILNLDLHPVAVHFPTAFAVSLLILSVVSPFLTGDTQSLFIYTMKILAIAFPIFTLGAIILGLIDGKLRFRKIKNSRILKIKIIYGSFLLVFSAGLAVLIWLTGFTGIASILVTIVLAAGSVAFATVLGLLGKSILNAAFPGK